MRPLRCDCGSTRFVLTETTTVTTSMLVDTLIDCDPEFKTNQVCRLYTFTCTNCGKTYMRNESDYVDFSSFDGEGLFFDLNRLLMQFRKDRYIGECNTNITVKEE